MALVRKPVSSSNISSIAYDDETQDMFVTFSNGSEYKYSAVPQDEFDEFVSAPSVGSYFHDNIKGAYRYVRV